MTLALLTSPDIKPRKAGYYVGGQFTGWFIRLLTAHLMFIETMGEASGHFRYLQAPRTSFAEFMDTFMLVGVILGCVRGGSSKTSLALRGPSCDDHMVIRTSDSNRPRNESVLLPSRLYWGSVHFSLALIVFSYYFRY
jgi:glycerol uptake facilitator-like aquaporin